MPGMEIFTISGAALGADAAPFPVQLQNALKALGDSHGDATLSAVTVDGAIGPKTVSALNYALKTYIGAGPVKAAGLSGRFLNGTATKADVQQYVGTLATIVINTVKAQGGTIPPPEVAKRAPRAGFAVLPPAPVADTSGTLASNPNLVWILGGGALVVIALGFFAARRHAAA